MKKHRCALVVLRLSFASFLCLIATGLVATAESAPSSAASQTIKGHIVNIEGEVYSVKDISGHEVQLRVTKETQVEGGLKPKVGDRIEAHVTADGQATSVALVVPEAVPPPASRQPVVPGSQ